ncbi:MAG: hypothetical protein O3A21_05020 [Proteobacteria bacterium]|nr:hypothetical protein [Pseudomonadota bacterium]
MSGQSGDTVSGNFSGATVTQNVVVSGVSYTQYVLGQGTLLIEPDITQNIIV